MASRVQVKCVERKMWGQRIYGGASGVIYEIPDGGKLYAISPSGARDPYDGVLPEDAAEFATFTFMRVADQAKNPAPVKASGGSASEAGGDGHVPDPDVNGDPGAPPAPLLEQIPAKTATVESWTAWAREHGLALSTAQKRQSKPDLITTIIELAVEQDSQS